MGGGALDFTEVLGPADGGVCKTILGQGFETSGYPTGDLKVWLEPVAILKTPGTAGSVLLIATIPQSPAYYLGSGR